MRSKQLWLLAVLIITACRPAPVPEIPKITQQIWKLNYTPALSWLGPALSLCTFQQAGTGLVVNELPAAALGTGQDSINFRWGAPDKLSGFPFVLGYDDLIIIVNAQNSIQNLSKSDLQDIFNGHIHSWTALKKVKAGSTGDIQVWAYPEEDEAQALFESVVLQNTFSNKSASIAPDPGAMRGAVAANPAAIGILPARWLDKSIHAVNISDAIAETLRQPILAITPAEPSTGQKSWLLCLQRTINP